MKNFYPKDRRSKQFFPTFFSPKLYYVLLSIKKNCFGCVSPIIGTKKIKEIGKYSEPISASAVYIGI